MKLIAFAIYDDKAACFNTPFFQPTTGLATRSLEDLVNDSNTRVNRHPGDFKLYKIGTYNDSSGKLESDAEPTFVANASDFLKQEA